MLSLSQMKEHSNSTYFPVNSTFSDQIIVELYNQLPIKNNEQLTDITEKISNKEEILFKLVRNNFYYFITLAVQLLINIPILQAKMLTLIGGSDSKQFYRNL